MDGAEGTVFVVDDDEKICVALDRLIRSVGLNARTFRSAGEFLEAYDPGLCGCLVLDVRMPGQSGLDLQAALKDKEIELPVVFITGHGNIPMSVRAMKAGAIDFLQKPFDDQVLLDAIQSALKSGVRRQARRAERAEILRRLDLLTPREREVLELVVTGRLNKQIAMALGLSEKTVKVHRARVMSKMEAESLPDLVLFAQAVGICRPNVQHP